MTCKDRSGPDGKGMAGKQSDFTWLPTDDRVDEAKYSPDKCEKPNGWCEEVYTETELDSFVRSNNGHGKAKWKVDARV